MEDWRLRGQEDYLSNATLYRVQFPEFWKCAYETKNPFYQKISAYANDYVKKTGKEREILFFFGKNHSLSGLSVL